MPRGGPRPGTGGARPGAGRPRKEPKPTVDAARDIRAAAKSARLTPLDYMLGVLNDEGADPARRDRMAQAAAPYVHQKASDIAQGKKEQAAEAAKTAGQGSDWGDDLAFVHAPPN